MNIIRTFWNFILFMTVIEVFKENPLFKKLSLFILIKLKGFIIYLLNTMK